MTLLTKIDIEKDMWMGGQRDKVIALREAYEKTQAQLAYVKKLFGPKLASILSLALSEGLNADTRVDEVVAENAQEMLNVLNGITTP